MIKSVRLGYMTINVREMTAEEAKERGVNGWWDYENATIEVAENLNPQVKAEILLHEILHACCTLGNVELSEDDEERAVNGIAPVLLGLIRRSPDIIDQIHSLASEPRQKS